MFQDDFRGELGANAFFARESYSGDALQYRTLTSRLVTADDELGKVNVLADPASAER